MVFVFLFFKEKRNSIMLAVIKMYSVTRKIVVWINVF